MFLGKWEIDDFLTFVCNTHDPADGAAADADGVATYRVYEDETGTPILTGSLALFDAANTVGFYSERIQLTAANGFENGKQYTIYITATVDSIAGTMSHNFQVDNQLAGIETKIDTIDTNVDAILVDTGTTIPADLSAIDGKIDIIDTNVDSILVDTGTDIPATLSTIDGKIDTIDSNVDLILADTNELQTDWTNGGRLDLLLDAIKAVTDLLPDAGALTTIDANIDAILVDTGTTIPGTLSTIDGKIDTIDTVVDAIKAVTDLLPDAGALTTIDGNVDAILVDTGTTLPAEHATLATAANLATIDTVVDGIKAVTDLLPDAGALNDLAAILTDTGTTLPAEHALLATPADVAAALATYDGPTRAEATSDKDEIIAEVDANEAKIDIIDTNVDAILIDTGTDIPATLTTIEGKIDTVDTVVDAIQAVTDNLPDSGQLLDLALILTDTGTTLPAQIGALENLSAANVQTVLETNDLDHLLKVAHPTGDPVADTILDLVMNKDGSQTFDRADDSLEGQTDGAGTPPTAAAVADAVWDEAISEHTGGTTFGGKNQKVVPSETINDYKADVSALASQASVDTIDGNVDAILVDTGTDIPATLSTIEGKIDTVDTVVDAIQAVTDLLPDAGALTTIDSNIDAILVDTGTDLPAQIGALNNLASSDVQTVLENNDLDHLAKVAHPTGDPVVDTLLDLVMNKDGSQTFDRSTDSLEGQTDGGGTPPSAAVIADAVWDEDIADHTTSTKFGGKNQKVVPSETINDYKADVSALATAAALATVDTVVDAIQAVTDNLPDSGQLLDLALILTDTGTTLPGEHAALSSEHSALATSAALATHDGKLDTVDTNVDAIQAVTDNLPDSGQLLDLAAILLDTGTTLPAQIGALNNLSSANVQTVLETNDLDHLAKVAHPTGDPVADTLLDLIMNKDGSQTFDRSTDSLEGQTDGGGTPPSAAVIADAVWNELAGDHTGGTTFGGKNQIGVPSATLNDYKADVSGLATAAALATVDSVVDAIKLVTDALPDAGALNDLALIKAVTDLIPDAGAMNDLALILADTGELQTDWTDGGRLDLILDAVKVDTAAILVDTGTTLPAILASLATAAALATVDANVDAILIDTGTTIPAQLTSQDSDLADILTDTSDILTDTGDILDDTADILTDTAAILAAIGGGPPAGAITFDYNLTNSQNSQPIADADVWVTTDEAGTNVIASGKTDQFGDVTFYLDAGTVYVWSQKTGFDFDNPDTEVIS